MAQQIMAIDVPVLVIGAGPTGLMMASELARHGIQCRIVEKAARPSELSKALAIHARTLEIFENLGIAEPFVTAGVKAHGGSLHAEGKRIVHFEFTGLESRYNYALMLPQERTEALLEQHLEGLGVKVERSVEMTALAQDQDSITATLRYADGRQEHCRAQYLIGCDGAHSAVRHALNLGFEGAEYEETFALADIHVDSSLPNDEISGFANEDGVVFFFPITEGRFRILADVQSVHPGDPTVEDFQKILDDRCHMVSRLHDSNWTAYFRIHRRQASSYRVGRAFLAGDAAHIHSPAGGQGMNTGLQDAYNLAWKLALTMKGVVKPAVLDSYAHERHAVGRQVLRTTDAMTKMMELRHPVAQSIRNRLVSALASTEIFQSMISHNMSELYVNYRDSPIVGEFHEGLFESLARFGNGPRAGDRAPDANGLHLEDGKTVRLFELLRNDNRHTLLLFGGAGGPEAAQVVSTANDIAGRYEQNVTVYLTTPADTAAKISGWKGAVIVDESGALQRAYHAVAAGAYLIRPDGYVGYRAFPPEPEHLREFLARIFA